MSREIIHRLWKMVIVLLLQLIILNHVHVLTYATPVIIAYVTMNFQRGASRVGLLLWGFVTGLLYDVFSNTMGLGMCSATLLAMMQPLLLSLFTPRDAADDMVPSFHTMGAHRYILYAFFSMLIFHIVFYALDAFTLSNWPVTLMAMGIGGLIAFVIVVFAQTLLPRKN